MKLKPFLPINDDSGLHLARMELAPAVFAAIDSQREYLRHWFPWVDATQQLTDTENFIRESMRQNSEGARLTTFIVKGGTLAGSLSVVGFNRENKSCEIGYWLLKELQGGGLMTRACQVFIQYLFRSRSINRIEVRTAADNFKSQAVPVRLGFTKEGVLREGLLLYGEYHHLVLYSLLKKEWEDTLS